MRRGEPSEHVRLAPAPLGARLEAQCARFNAEHPVGSTIRVWPGAVNERPPVPVTVVAPGAYVLGGHTAVVRVTGGHGCIALSHVMRDLA